MAANSEIVYTAPIAIRDDRSIEEGVQMQLHMTRALIQLHKIQNPDTPYDADTRLDTFWDALVQGSYIKVIPTNPMQNNSSKVAAKPAHGIGWVWAESIPGNARSLSLLAVDVNGHLFDPNRDGIPN